ncbi:MAG: flagellar export chaperone FliS [Myxococcales bacterium]|nr:flagellar export chaperone FliS [Myxococcales bacterium]
MSFALTQYQQAQVETASPVRVVVQLYASALRRIAEGRQALEARDYPTAAASLGRAHAIVSELQASLDASHAPELCAELSGLYDFCLHRLREASTKSAPALLEPVENVLRELEQAWQDLAQVAP